VIADDSVIPSERSSSHQEDLGVPYLIADVDVDLIDRFGAHQTMRGFSANTVRRRRWTLRNLTIEAGVGLDAIEERHVVAFLSRRTTATTRRSLLGDIRCFYR
jgi:hypothetical protein